MRQLNEILKSVLLGFFMIFFIGYGPVDAKPIDISLSTSMGPQSPEYKALERFAEILSKESNGELKLTLFGSSVIGSDETAFKALSMGSVDIYMGSINIATKMYVPELDYFTPPFVYSDFDHFIRFCKSDYAKEKFELLRKKAGVIMLNTEWTWQRGPFRVICTKKPINSLEDLEGLKLRFYPSNLELKVWETLGTTPIVIPWSETYLALQQGMVEAVTSPVSLIMDSKFVEVAPYVTRIDEYPQTICFFMNQKKFNGLSEPQQNAIIKACNQAGTEFTGKLNLIAKRILDEAKEKYNIQFSEIDMEPFIERAQQFYNESRKQESLPKEFWEVMDAIEAVR